MKLRSLSLTLSALLSILLVASCTPRRECWADVVCTRAKGSSHLLKWELYPSSSGNVKVFASTSPNRMLKSRYVGKCKIDEHQFLVKHDPRRRTYYTLKFDNGVVMQVAERKVFLSKAHNMRDVGGYQTASKSKIRWGKVFRTGHIDSLHQWERIKFEKLGIRTVVDIRETEEFPCELTQYVNMNYVHVPIPTGNKERLLRQLISGEHANSENPEQFIFDMISDVINNHTDDFRHIFSVLKLPQNYPVLIQGAAGKGRVGVVVALLMAAVDVRYEEIVKDYQLSNDYLDIPNEIKAGYNLPVNAQVAITHLYTAREKYMNTVFQTITDEYGSLDNYFSQGLGLTLKDRAEMAKCLTMPLYH